MARILILAVVAVLLLGGVIAADQTLQNPDMEPASNATDDQQQEFVEASTAFLDAAPVFLFALVIGTVFAAIRVIG